jgi:hypothetical protein
VRFETWNQTEELMDKLALATAVALSIGGTALAQEAEQRIEPPPGDDRTDIVSFENADRNGDGVVNSEEGNLIDGFDFSRADTNDDELLSRQEFQLAMATATPRGDGQPELSDGDRTAVVSFERADTNSDGVLSNEEANDIPGFDFSRADVDDDKMLNREEFQSAMANAQPR